ncbi:MAG: DUF481 domain-containing protein [Alphaproteobacteria bacterium]|nr:DUF481 domain-containing protein [Alphaproteobacteria bacterium]
MRSWPLISLAAAASCLPLPARAAEWTLTPEFTLLAIYDNNLTLKQENEQNVTGGSAIANLTLARKTARLETSLSARADFTGYSPNSDLNSDEQRLRFASSYRFERSLAALNAEYFRDTTLTLIEDENRGDVTSAERVTSWSVSPAWIYELSALDRVEIAGSFRRREYDTPTRTNFDFYGASLIWTRVFRQDLRGTATIALSKFEPEGLSAQQTIVTPQVGIQYTPTERFSVSASAGPQYIKTEQPVPFLDDEEEWGYAIKFGTNYLIDPRTKFQASFSREAEPTGDGALRDRDRLSMRVEHRWSELLTLRLSGNLTMVDNTRFASSSAEETWVIEPALVWRLAPDLDLTASYRYRFQAYADGTDVESHGVRVGVNYELDPLRWSE